MIVGTNLDEGRLLMPLEMPVGGAPLPSDAQLMQWSAAAAVHTCMHAYMPAWVLGVLTPGRSRPPRS